MTHEDDLNRIMNIINDPRDYTVSLPNKTYAVSSKDGERGMVLFDLRDESQRTVFESLASYVSIQREMGGE